jgi:hypothetical protein
MPLPFHKIGRGLFVIVAFSLVSMATAPAAEPSPEPDNECDMIAALRLPFSSTTAVHETQEADWIRGVTVCEAEVRAHPEEMRFVH